MENYYAALNYTDTIENDNHHNMVKIQLHGEKESVTINAMIDSGATEDFIASAKKYLASDPSALRPDASDVASAFSTPCAP